MEFSREWQMLLHFWGTSEWQKAVSTGHRTANEDALCNCLLSSLLLGSLSLSLVFFVSQNEKETDTTTDRRGKKRETEEIRLVLQSISSSVSVYVTCLKQSRQSQMKFWRESKDIIDIQQERSLRGCCCLSLMSFDERQPEKSLTASMCVCVLVDVRVFLAWTNEYDRSFELTREANEISIDADGDWVEQRTIFIFKMSKIRVVRLRLRLSLLSHLIGLQRDII